jgi:hypothetical protein
MEKTYPTQWELRNQLAMVQSLNTLSKGGLACPNDIFSPWAHFWLSYLEFPFAPMYTFLMFTSLLDFLLSTNHNPAKCYSLNMSSKDLCVRNLIPAVNQWVAPTSNPSYSGGRDQEDHGSKPAQENSLWDPMLKKTTTHTHTYTHTHAQKGLVEWLEV